MGDGIRSHSGLRQSRDYQTQRLIRFYEVKTAGSFFHILGYQVFVVKVSLVNGEDAAVYRPIFVHATEGGSIGQFFQFGATVKQLAAGPTAQTFSPAQDPPRFDITCTEMPQIESANFPPGQP